MSNLGEKYFAERDRFLKNLSSIEKREEEITQFLIEDVILPASEGIFLDFYKRPLDLKPFWINYPPEQRGRQPKGTSIPWLELGEKTTSFNIIHRLSQTKKEVMYPGLPTGGDIRFVIDDVYVHLDIKLTGPNDNPDEVVVPPNQVSGDGSIWNNGVENSTYAVLYQSGIQKGTTNYQFQPKLPPFYFMNGKVLLCLTYFLETVYEISGFGDHPLKYLELSCVPNGLLMFDGPEYCNQSGFIIAGKDEKSKPDHTKRVRIRLNPLSEIANWRSVKFIRSEEKGWTVVPRKPT